MRCLRHPVKLSSHGIFRSERRGAVGSLEPRDEKLVTARHVGAERPKGQPVIARRAGTANHDLLGEPDARVGKVVVQVVGQARHGAENAVDDDIIRIR